MISISGALHDLSHAGSSALHTVTSTAKAGLNDVKSAATDTAHAATSVVSDAGKVAKSGVKDVAEGASAAAHAGGSLVQHALSGASGVANSLFEGAKAGLTSVASVAKAGASDVATGAKDAVKGVESAARAGVKGAEDLGKDGLKEAGKGALLGLNAVGDVVQGLRDHESAKDKKYDSNVSNEVSAQMKELNDGQGSKLDNVNESGLIKQVEGIHSDSTRIKDISEMYDIQNQQVKSKLGDTGATWDGWANKAAALVNNVHGGNSLTAALGKITGADSDLAQGNKEVFSDIAPVTNSFLQNVDKFQDNGKFDQSKFDKWFNGQKLTSSSDQTRQTFEDGFQDYAESKYSSGDDKQAYETAGTVRMAQHEQTELQPKIEEAMDGGAIGDALKDVKGLADKIPGVSALTSPASSVYKDASQGVATAVIPSVQLAPGQTLNVTKDPSAIPGQGGAPSSIEDASGSAQQALDQAVSASGLQVGQTNDTGAGDYASLPERLKVLTAYMLRYSQTPITASPQG